MKKSVSLEVVIFFPRHQIKQATFGSHKIGLVYVTRQTKPSFSLLIIEFSQARLPACHDEIWSWVVNLTYFIDKKLDEIWSWVVNLTYFIDKKLESLSDYSKNKSMIENRTEGHQILSKLILSITDKSSS